MQNNKLSRRGVVAGGVAAAGLLGAPFVRSANAAGTLTIGLWDHWVPGANEVQSAIMRRTQAQATAVASELWDQWIAHWGGGVPVDG